MTRLEKVARAAIASAERADSLACSSPCGMDIVVLPWSAFCELIGTCRALKLALNEEEPAGCGGLDLGERDSADRLGGA